MEQYRLDIDCLPSLFYRVQYPTSHTIHDETGLSARGTISSNPDEDEFKDLVAKAFIWGSDVPSPFIKVFSEKDHAENWALKWLDVEDERCSLLTIESCQLDSVKVFKVSTLVNNLGINLPDGALQHKKGAYLCVHRIPARAVCTSESLSSIEASEVTRI